MKIGKVKTTELECYINVIQKVIDDITRQFSILQSSANIYKEEIKDLNEQLNYYNELKQKFLHEAIKRVKEIQWD